MHAVDGERICSPILASSDSRPAGQTHPPECDVISIMLVGGERQAKQLSENIASLDERRGDRALYEPSALEVYDYANS